MFHLPLFPVLQARFTILLSALLLLTLSGCGFRHIADLQNGGQSFAEVKTDLDATVATDSLAPKDSVVVADDGGHLVTAATNSVSVALLESQTVPLSLGIPDFDLRFGASLSKDEDKEPKKRFVLAGVKQVSFVDGRWQSTGGYQLTEEHILSGRVPVTFRVIAYNAGNRDFEGAMSFNDRLATNVEFDKVLSSTKVADASTAKALLSIIPIVGILTVNMDQFQPVANAQVRTRTAFDQTTRVLRHRIDPIKLAPGEGVEIRFTANLLLPRDEALLKARLRQPKQR